MKTCTIDGCDRVHRAEGLCATHYNQHMPAAKRHPKVTMRCAWCDVEVIKDRGRDRRYAHVFCGLTCRDAFRATPTSEWSPPVQMCRLPDRHPAVTMQRAPAPRLFVSGPCRECGDQFTINDPSGSAVYCSTRCQRRVVKRDRKARERNSPGSFRLVEVIRVLLLNGRCCAYCDEPIVGLPDPDHVVPISRNGRNDISNLLPACRLCNADKSDMTLDEWRLDRELRGEPQVRTEFPATDPRWKHLFIGAASGTPYRDRTAAHHTA